MDVDIQKLGMHGTYRFEEVEDGRRLVGCKWAAHSNWMGNIAELTARLVATGYAQQPGIDFGELLAPVGTHSSLGGFCALDVHEAAAGIRAVYCRPTCGVLTAKATVWLQAGTACVELDAGCKASVVAVRVRGCRCEPLRAARARWVGCVASVCC